MPRFAIGTQFYTQPAADRKETMKTALKVAVLLIALWTSTRAQSLVQVRAGAVGLQWDLPDPIPNQTLTGFRIYRAEVIGGVAGDWAQVGADVTFPATTFTDKTVQQGKIYKYRATSFDTLDESIPSTEVWVFIAFRPNPPKTLKVRLL